MSGPSAEEPVPPDTGGIVAFLRARLDEEQAGAEATIHPGRSGRWAYEEWVETTPDGGRLPAYEIEFDEIAPMLSDQQWHAGPATMRHIARHDPARVLREVEAKRRIVDELDDEAFDGDLDVSLSPENWMAKGLLRLLALPYSDHPDYQEEWRP